MKTHFLYRLFSAFLVLTLLVQMVPMQIFATEDETAPDVTVEAVPMNSVENEPISKDARVLEEITDKRTEYTKQFRLSNGLNMAVVYPDAVHYDDNGQWREIDNTLTLSDSAYVNTAGEWEITLPQQFGNDNAVSITKDGHTLRFHMAGELRSSAKDTLSAQKQELTVGEATPSTAKKKNIAPSESLGAAGYPETVPDKLHSRVEYEDVYPGTDIIYDLNANQLKESIVIESYSQSLQGYRYILETGSMTPVLSGDNSIALLAPGTNEVVMVMPAPFLLDSAGTYCPDVTVELAGKDGKYVLTYLLPSEWMAAEDRQWPVVLDPVVATVSTISNIKDITVYSHAWSSYEGGVLECGWQESHGIARAFMQYADLPDLTSSDVVQSAELRLCRAYANSTTNLVEIHKVNETWSSTSVTWDTQPSYDAAIEDFAHAKIEDTTLVPTGASYFCWDITDIVQGWYETENTGLAITAPQSVEAGGTTSITRFWSSDYDIYQKSEKPTVTIYFRNNNGLEGYWDYTSSTAGRAGSGFVNNYTGNLVWTRGDLGFGGTQMPVSISHVYNLNDVITPNDNNNSNDSAGNTFGIGLGWRTSYNQLIYAWEIDGTTLQYYVWEDADGTDHYFTADAEGVIRDEDGLELTLTVNGTGNEKYCITDKGGNCMYFDAQGRLSKMTNLQQTKRNVTITYLSETSKHIDTITDGAGRKYVYTYNDNGLLDRISYFGSGSDVITYVDYVYDETDPTLLTRIEDADGEYCTYTYDSNKLLKTATDVDGYKLTYAYSEVPTDQPWRPYRVVSVEESHNSTAGGKLTLTYDHNQTTLTDHNGNKNILQFNNFGNLICVQDDEGKAMFAQYAFNTEEDAANNTDATAKGNQLRISSDLQYTVANLMADNNMRFTSLSWSTIYYAEKEITTDRCYADLSALAVSSGSDGENYSGIASGSFAVKPGQTQTFSCYVASPDCPVRLSAVSSAKTEVSETQPTNDEWYRLQVSYTNDSTEDQSVTYYVETLGSGTFYMDCPQLENAPTSSRYNLINNGDFNHTVTAHQWTGTGFAAGDGVTNIGTSAVSQLDGNVVKIEGDPKAAKRMTQTVFVDGNAGDYYTVGGWAKGNSAPITKYDTNARKFAIEAVIIYADEENTRSEPFTASFNPDSNEWQYAATAIFADKEFWKIEVSLIYDYNVNTAWFDGIQLYKDAFGDKLEYDEDGNVVSVLNSDNREATYEYEANDLVKETLPSGREYTYTYDDYHNVLTATSDEGLVYTFTYDQYGNVLTSSVGSGESAMTSSTAYSVDGNRIVSTTDAMGNTTLYDYDPDTNMLNWVQYPEDTETTRTSYEYDDMFRMDKVQALTSEGKQMSVSYTYDNDLLTTVTTPSTTYTFNYGAFSLASDVKIGSRVLASYSYTDDRNFYLKRLDYGNEDSVQYEYDEKGRILSATYEDGETVTYTYDHSGRTATVSDSSSGTVSTFGYDYIDRISVYKEKNADNELTLSYSYYVANKKLKTLLEVINGHERGASYIYDGDERLTSYQKANGKREYTYDTFDRIPSYVTSHKNSDGTFGTVLTTAFTFASSAVSTTSGRVASMSQTGNGFTSTYSYTYDKNGNILSVTDANGTTTYEYDSLGQLLRENNFAGNFTHVWSYDNAGNILSRTEYAYTTGDLTDLTPTDTVTYGYNDDKGWGDLLTAYDGVGISYDGIGNPLNDGTWNYTWQHGRQLASMSKADNSQTWTFTYNADGLRTKRTDGTNTYEYVYYGGLLQYMEYNNTPVYFTHAPDGTPMGMLTAGNAYFYVTNLQGDVVGIVDATGSLLVSYTYDAWGNPLSTTGTLANTIGTLNPLRYRGYIYDTETGLYYLQSRYYNPEIGRFLNADGYTSTGQGFVGDNMFAYCGNNPICRVDYSGDAWCDIWGWLFYFFDMGYIHRQVQGHIKTHNANIITEEALENGRRPDVVDSKTGVVWEVKHEGKNPAMRILAATAQAQSYLNQKLDKSGVVTTDLGNAGAFNDWFMIECLGGYYRVDYYTPSAGVILYRVTKLEGYKGRVFASYPKTMVDVEIRKMMAPIGQMSNAIPMPDSAAAAAYGFTMGGLVGTCLGMHLKSNYAR